MMKKEQAGNHNDPNTHAQGRQTWPITDAIVASLAGCRRRSVVFYGWNRGSKKVAENV